jgi:SLT domain-containing protein
MKYRKKPVVVEAVQWHRHGDHPAVEPAAGNADGSAYMFAAENGVSIDSLGWLRTLEGGHVVSPGDWIIRGVKGELYPCKPDIFAATYEALR